MYLPAVNMIDNKNEKKKKKKLNKNFMKTIRNKK